MERKRGGKERRPVRAGWRIAAFVPAVFLMGMIFVLSAQPADDSGALSEFIGQKVFAAANDLFARGWDAQRIADLSLEAQHTLRKAAHFTEYLLLGIALVYGFRINFPIGGGAGETGAVLRRWALPAFVLAVLYAASDELHQRFVPGRSGMPGDVLIDSAGALAGVLLFAALHVLRGRRGGQKAEGCAGKGTAPHG